MKDRPTYQSAYGRTPLDDVWPCLHCGQVEQQHWSDGVCFTDAELGDRMKRLDFRPRPDAADRQRGDA